MSGLMLVRRRPMLGAGELAARWGRTASCSWSRSRFLRRCPRRIGGRGQTGRAHGERHQSLVAGGGSRTGIAVQASPAECAYSMARRVCLDIDSISADGACRVAVPVLVRVYAFVADRTPRPAVAVIISADVLTANRASRIAVLISVGVYGAIAVNACRITRSIRVKAAALGVQRKNGYRQH
jgi:hypothetical protein